MHIIGAGIGASHADMEMLRRCSAGGGAVCSAVGGGAEEGY